MRHTLVVVGWSLKITEDELWNWTVHALANCRKNKVFPTGSVKEPLTKGLRKRLQEEEHQEEIV